MLSHLLTTNLDKTCNAITCADTFFMVYKNLNSDQQQQLLEQTKSRLLYLEPSSENNSILHIAIRNGHKDLLEALIKNDYKVNAQDSDGRTALMLAAQSGHKDVVEALICKGAEVNAKTPSDWTALMIAALSGHKDVVEALIDGGAEVNAKASDDWTALMLAAQRGHKDIVEVLLGKGAKVNAQKPDGCTALMLAAQNGHKDIVEVLIGGGAKVNAKASDDCTALMLAAQNGHKDLVEYLLGKGAKVNAKASDDWTALMLAAQRGHKDIVEVLLDGGAKVNAQKSDGCTALMLAAINTHKDVVEVLLDAALRMASRNGKKDSVQALFRLNRDISGFSVVRRTDILKCVAECKEGEYINKIFDIGKDNLTEENKQTLNELLVFAARKDNFKLVEKCLKYGADVNYTSVLEYKGTALTWAAFRGYDEIVTVLVSTKDINLIKVDEKEHTALYWAIKKNKKSCIKLILEKSSVEQLLSIYLNPKESGLCGPVVLNKLNEFDANEIITKLITDKVPCRSNTIDLFQLCLNQCLDIKNTPNEECITKLIKYGIDSPDFMRYCNGYRGNHNFTDPKLAAFFAYAKTKYFGISCSGEIGLKRFAKILWPSDSDDKAKSNIDAIKDYIESRSGGCFAFLRSHNRSSAALDAANKAAAQQAQAMNLAEDEACPSQEGEDDACLS
jgi:ankyrin repeat protein